LSVLSDVDDEMRRRLMLVVDEDEEERKRERCKVGGEGYLWGTWAAVLMRQQLMAEVQRCSSAEGSWWVQQQQHRHKHKHKHKQQRAGAKQQRKKSEGS
jgi:hypothetical protein